MKRLLTIILLASLIFTFQAHSAKILFDYTKDERAGNADWVIDTNYPIPSPSNPTAEDDWAGAISAWGYEMYLDGHTCHTLTNSYGITYGDGGNAYDLSNYDVFVVCEPQNQFTASEKTAILAFVNAGGGLFIVANHYSSDRNSSGWDSPEIWNDLGTDAEFGMHFQVSGDSYNSITYTSSRVETDAGDPITRGSEGDVNSFAFHAGTTITLNTGNNATALGHIWYDSGHNYVMFATAEYGSGRVCAVGDSSPADDGTGFSGDDLYDGWNEADDNIAFLNGMLWLLETSCDASDVTAPDWTVTGDANLIVNPGNTVNGLNWDDATDAQNPSVTYSVYRDTTTGFTPGVGNRIVQGLSNSEYTDTGLTNGTPYYYRVSVENCVPLSRNNNLADEASGIPTGGGGSPLDISGYQIFQFDNPVTFTFPASTSVDPAQYIIIARQADQATFEAEYGTLPAGTMYFNGFDVIGGNGFPVINGNEYYELKDELGVTIETTYDDPGADPFAFHRNNPGDDASLLASWTSNHTASPGSGVGTTSDAGLIINEITDESAVYQTAYIELYYDAPAGGTCETGDTTAPNFPGGNSGISVADLQSGGDLNISWNQANDLENPDSVRYALYRDTSANFTPAVGNRIATDLSTLSYNDSGLTNGTTYYYTIQTYNCAAQQTTNTDESYGVPTDPALAPTLNSPTPGDSENSISWSSVTGSDEYRLYYATVDGGPYALLHSTTVTSYTHTGLTNGTTYYYVVKNYDAIKFPNLSNNSNQVSGTPTSGGSGCATDLIISEYVESGIEKYIEIYNGTGSAVDLSDYELQLYSNGSPTVSKTSSLSGNLNDGEVIVYKNSGASQYPSGIDAIAVDFSGDDAIALYKVSTTSLIDVIGQIGFDPGSFWGTSPTKTADATLVRKSTVTDGDANGGDAFDPATEWDGTVPVVYTNLGSHTMTCAGCDTGDLTAPDWTVSGVSNLVVTDPVTDGDLNLNWDDAADAENPTSIKYAVYRDTTSGFTPAVGNRIATGLTASSYNDSGLTNGTPYYYRIETYNCNANTRNNSDEGSGTPTAPAALTIYDVQYTTTQGAECYHSPEETNSVTLIGIVSAIKTSNSYVIAESSAPWHSIYVYDSSNNPAVGDEITITGTVDEYNGLTEITTVTGYNVDSLGNPVYGPYTQTVETIGGSAEWGADCNLTTEPYEGLLITLYNVEVSSPSSANGYWRIKDQGGTLHLGVDDTFYAETVTNGQQIDQITGILLYSYGYYRLNPRNAGDITFSSCNTGDVTSPDWTVAGDSNLVVTDPATGGALNLNWDDAADAENPGTVLYAVYRDTTSGFTPAVGNRIATALGTSAYNDSGLTNGLTYYYRIETYNCNANTRYNTDEGSGVPTLAVGKKWTIAVFMNGDNNLEGAAIEDFLEMSAVGSDANFDIVVQMDRIGGYDSSYDNWTTTKRFHITNGMTPTIANAVSDIGEANMGDGNTLVAFAEWVKDNYPAQHYAFIIWDHGDGWRSIFNKKGDDDIFKGASQDETNGWDYLDFTSGTPGVRGELGLAFDDILTYYGAKLDILGFDVCLDQMWENNVEAQDAFDYFVASEMSEWFDGWAYTAFLNDIAVANGNMTGAEVAQSIVDAYAAGESGSSGDTQSSVDLSQIPALSTAIDEFAIELMYNKTAYGTEIASARSNCFELDNDTPYYNQIDLYDFCLKLESESVPQSLKDKSIAVRNAVNAAVLNYYNRLPSYDTFGIGIYYPRTSGSYESDYDSTLIAATNNWDNFIKGEILTDPVILTYSTHTIDDSAGNGDGVADPGETVNMPVTLHNSGTSTATGISATLSTASTYITITSNSSTYPDITSGSNGTTNSNYSFSVDGACPVGTIITFTLDIVASAGYTNQDTFQVQIGTLPEIDISGWKLTQIDNGAFFTFPGGTAIPENGYLILGRNATQSEFEAHWGVTLGPNTVYVNSNNVCPQINGGETYKLEDDTSTMIDGVTGYTLASGNTIQRNNPGDDPTLSPSWSSSSYSSSTPGSGVGTPSNSGVVINEYSDASSYVFEYVELYYDTTSVSCSDTDVTAPAWPGGAVANLTVTPSDQTNDLNWDDAADLENPTTVKYAVYRDTTTGFTPAVGNRIVTALSASSYSDSGLVNGTTYFYRVETYNCNANSQLNSDEGSGTPSDCFMTDTTAPDWAVSGVSNITVVSTASTSLNLSWDQATDAENTDVTYDLYRSETSPVDTSTAAVVISDYSGLSYNNIGLTEGTTYYYKVVAKNCMPLERTGSDEVKGVTSTGGGSGCATDLIISEYIEGSSFEKYIEIYNGTGSAVDLSNYELQLYSNGSPTPSTTTPLSGTLNDGEVQVYRNNLATLYPSAISCPAVDFNGDDAVALHKVSPDSLIDVIGQIGTDPGSSWGTSPTITVNATLVRKSSVTGGDTNGGDAFDPATEWDGYPQDTVSYLGSHTMDCGAPPPCDDTDVTSPDWTVAGDANLVVTDPESGTALNLDWDDAIDSENSDSIRYAVYRSTETGFIPAVSNRIITALVSSTYNNNGLTRGTTYYYRIETYNCNANTRYNTDEGSGIPTEPAQAPTLDSAVKGDQQVSLTWSPVSGSDEYRLYYSTFDGGPYSLVLSTTANAYVQTGLTNGTTYYYVVQNYDIEKYPELSDNSNQLSATPNPPSGNDMDVSGWKVVNKEGSGGYTYEIPDNTVIPESGYLVIGRDATQSAFETFWGVTLGADVIYLNSNNSITLNGGEYFELQNSFDVVMDGPTGYTLQVSKSGQRTNPGDPADNPASWTVVVALTEANPGSGVGTSSNAGVVINEYSDADSYVYEFIEIYNDSTGPADNDPPIFAGLQTVTDTQLGGELELAWNTASDTTPPIVYNIYMSTTSGGQNFSTPDYSTSNLTYTVDTLTNGTTYYFVVRARDNKWNEDTNAVEVFGIPSSKFADPAAGDILINEFNAKGTERVEIYNTSGSDTFNLCNLDVVTSLGTYNIYDNSGEAYIEPGEYIFFTLSGALSNDGDTITIQVGPTEINKVAYGVVGGAPITYSTYSTARISNTGNYANDWNRDPTPTFGAVNDASAVNLGSSIVINEYQTNATSGTNILELYNPTGGDIDVTGWFFTDSDATYSSIGTLTGTVTASGYLVFTRDLTTPSANVSINGDAIYLYDSTGVRVDQASDYDYSIASGNTGQRVPNGTGGTNDGYNWITSGFTDQEPTWDATNNLCDNTDTTAPDWAVSGVSNVAAVFVSDHVEVSWDIATDAENPNKIYYNIHRSLVSGFTPDGGNLVDTVLNLTSYNDFGADKLQTNYYKISVHNCDNDSRNGTDEASVWVPDPPEIPVIISCSGGNQAIFIDWGDITGAEYYNIYRATDEGGPYLVEDTSTTSKFTDSNVINGTTYYYVITTYDSTKNPNESDYSDERYAIPETCYPIGDTVLISEICIDPRVGIDDMYGEWIELYNPTDTPISIDGWSLSDTGIDTHTIGVECPEVPAYGYLLMAATSNPVLNDNLDWDYIYCRASGGPGCFALKDGEDEVILKDAAGNTVDLLIYDDTWFDRGYSITKVDMLACSNQVDSWDNETTQWNPPDSGYGTPGTSNFPFGLYFAEATTLTQVDFSFIHEVDNASADDILKYTIYESSTPGNVITLSVLSLDPDNIHGTLTTANLTPGMKYTLEISNIQDAYLRPVTVEFSKYEFFAPMQLTDGLNPILFPEWSNDGNSVAYVVYDINTTKSQVWIAAVDGSSTNQITNDSDAVWHGGQLTWSIDDQWVAYTALQSSPVNHGQIRKINVNSTGGDSEKLEPPSSDSYGWGRWTDPDWTTATNQWDGTEKMAISISGDIWVCDPNLIAADHLSLVRLTQFSMPYSDYTTVDKLYQPKWSEDNNSITFVRRHPGAGTTETDIYVIENVQTYLSAGTTISNWANPDVTLLSDAAELYVWSPSFSLDNSMVSYVNDTSGNFNNTTFWSTPGVAISASNFDAYMEKSSGLDTDGQVMESTSDNEGFMKWAPAGGDRFTFVERTADGTYSLKLLSNQITVGFSKAKKNSGKIFDFSYSGIILSYKDLGTGQLSIEAPFINVKDYTSPPNYKYIGEVREILINEDVVELNDYADVQIHFRNAEVRNLDVNSLKIFYLNKDKNQWIKLGGTVMMDDTGGTVYAQTKFTGTFAIFGKTTSTKAPLVSKEVRVFPNPYRPNDGDIITGTPDSFIIFNHLPEDVETIEIYSIAGEKIATSDDTILINNAMNTARWNAANVSGSKVASGIYIYVIKSQTETKTGKIAIIK